LYVEKLEIERKLKYMMVLKYKSGKQESKATRTLRMTGGRKDVC
jgi:hypothetical protein